MIRHYFFILLVTLLFSSCASMFKGTKEEVFFQSTPSQAQVFINNEPSGQTPLRKKLLSNKEYLIHFEKEGYEKEAIKLGNHIGGGWIVLDILTIYGLFIDGYNGAWYYLNQDSISVNMKPVLGSTQNNREEQKEIKGLKNPVFSPASEILQKMNKQNINSFLLELSHEQHQK